MYNDPGETVDLSRMNATAEDTFPNSWFMPPTGVERGSIMDFSGDPLTPGYPSKGMPPADIVGTRKSITDPEAGFLLDGWISKFSGLKLVIGNIATVYFTATLLFLCIRGFGVGFLRRVSWGSL